MASSTTSFAASRVGLRLPQSVSTKCCSKASLFPHPTLSLSFHTRPQFLWGLASQQFNPNCELGTGSGRLGRTPNPFIVRSEASSTGWGQITQQDFMEIGWQAVVSSLEVAKENKHQIVETEHLMKALLEQKNGLARRIFAKDGVDNNSRLLEATDKYIQAMFGRAVL